MANNLPTRDLFRESLLFPIESQFDKFFDKFFNSNSILDNVKATVNYPKMDVISDNGYLKVQIAVPGVKKDDLEITIDNNILRIKGKMSEGYQSTSGRYHVKELRKSVFVREMKLPDWAKNKDPTTSLLDGILLLTWEEPKQEVIPEENVKRIEIK